MGAYVYLNMAIIYQNMNDLKEAVWAFRRCVDVYHADELLPDDVLICGTGLCYKTGDTEQYRRYEQSLLEKTDDINASEFMDACQVIFDCAMDAQDDDLVREVFRRMDTYLAKYPREINIGLRVEECKYQYAKVRGSEHEMLRALERKDRYYKKVYTVKKELLDVGKRTVKSNQGNEIPMYDLERTICDLVRSRSSIEAQDFNAVLKAYVGRKDKDLNKLMKYVKLFRVDKIVRNYMEVLL